MISKLVVIAGSGTYPEMIVKGAKKAGVPRVDVVAVKGSTSRATCAAADNVYRISIGEIATGIRAVGERGYDGLVLAGQINPLSLFRSRFDEATKEALKSLPVKNAHSVFTKLIEMFEEVGCKVLPASLYMDSCLPGEGALTKRGLTPGELSDVQHAMAVAADMGVHDVGQTVVVKSGMVLAVEAFEGTNAAIKRAGRLGGRGGVIFKAARSGHDMRFDIPVVGLKTLKVMKRAGVSALAFQAGRLIMLDREKVLSFADKHSIALVGINSGLPYAPTRV
jgi:DUF1009 family protein